MADPYLTKLREVIRQISEDKITAEGEDRESSYYIRKDIENMQLSEVTDLLRSTEWAEDRTEEMIRESMENSCPYGLFLKAGTGEGRIKESTGVAKQIAKESASNQLGGGAEVDGFNKMLTHIDANCLTKIYSVCYYIYVNCNVSRTCCGYHTLVKQEL